MKVVIFYVNSQRELQNAYLIKHELIKRGHEVYVLNPIYLDIADIQLSFTPDVVLVPYLYISNHFHLFKRRFKEQIPRIINLQYEQIFSDNEFEDNIQIPKDKNKNAIHICWSKKWRDNLVYKGLRPENSLLIGSLNLDMCRKRFDTIYNNREYISRKYNLDIDKKWIIFISSLVFADMTESWKNFHYKSEDWGKEKTDERRNIDTLSRNIILEWINRYIKENDCEFIYRPHLSEEININLYEMENNNNNFHIIRDDSIRTWIKNCDVIHTWYSTSITEIYFMGKNCSILRPLELPKSMHNKLLNSGYFTKTYEDFLYFNINGINKFPVDKDLILEEFYIDKKEYTYEKICDLVEEIVENNIVMDLY